MTRKIRLAIVENEFVIAEDMRECLEQAGYEVTGVFDTAEIALTAIIKDPPDLTLVDIKLAGETDGISLVKQMQAQMEVPVVFITANSDHAMYERAKSTCPQAFLIKPFTPVNLLTSIDLALYNFSAKQVVSKIDATPSPIHAEEFVIDKCLFVRVNGRFKKIKCEDILFAEASGSYTHIQTTEQRFTIVQNLGQFERKADLLNLIRIHRSYVVNINRVDSFDDSSVYIQNQKLPLSETHRNEFLTKIKLI